MNASPRVRSMKIMGFIQVLSQSGACSPKIFENGLKQMQTNGDTKELKRCFLQVKVPQHLTPYVNEVIELLGE